MNSIKGILTNPKGHNPENFIYLVNALLNHPKGIFNDSRMPLEEMKKRISRIKDSNLFYRTSLVGKLSTWGSAEKFGTNFGGINQTGTFGNFGLLINPAHEDLIYVAWNCDLGSPRDPEELKDFALKNKGRKKFPFYLLTKTVGPEDIKYNELIIKGNEDTNIQGVFYKCSSKFDGKSEAKILKDLVQEAIDKEIPLVEIPEKPIKDYSHLSEKDRKLSRSCDFLRAQCKIMQSHSEFYNQRQSSWKWETSDMTNRYEYIPKEPIPFKIKLKKSFDGAEGK